MKLIRTGKLLFAFIFVLVSFAACGEKTTDSVSQKDTAMAAVTFVSGELRLIRNDSENKVTIGERLNRNDIIETGSNSSADIAIKGLGILKVGADTRLVMETLEKSGASFKARVHLNHGNVVSVIQKADSNSDYEVATPTAVAGVRGTIFMTEVEKTDDKSRDPKVAISVLSGSVSVKTDESEVVLGPETRMAIESEKKLRDDMIQPLSPESLREIKRRSVFHKTGVGGFDVMMKEMEQTMPELQDESSAESTTSQKEEEEAEMNRDVVKKASKVQDDKHIKRDTEGDPVKIEAEKSYEKE